MNRLIVNVGNTQIRFGVFSNSSSPLSPPLTSLNIVHRLPKKKSTKDILALYHKEVVPHLKKALGDKPNSAPEGVMVSVAPSHNAPIKREIKATLGIKMRELTHKDLPQIPYSPPEGMGIDRLIKIVVMEKLYPRKNILILDFGTALTLDALTTLKTTKANKADHPGVEYLGGMIIPGFRMSLRALHHNTEKLPDLLPASSPHLLSHSTKGCITGGTFHFFVQALEGIIEQVHRQFFRKSLLILTGGDMEYFKKHLQRSSRLTRKVEAVKAIEHLNLIATHLLSL